MAYTYFIKIYCDKGRYICFINKRYVIFPFQIYIYIIYEKTSPESGEICEWDPWQFCIFLNILRTSQPMRTTTCIHFFFIWIINKTNKFSGGRNVSKATYIPHSYAKSQNLWIDNFYASNGYLEVMGPSGKSKRGDGGCGVKWKIYIHGWPNID